MKHSDAFPSNYLSKEDVAQPVTATIEDVYHQTVKGETGDEKKAVMSFVEETIKPMILNNTNWTTCEEMYGEDSDAWKGKKIELYHDPTIMFGKKRVGGIRIRTANKPTHPNTNSTAPTSKLWQRWAVLCNEATEFGLSVPQLDPASNDDEVTKAGKALAALINAERNKAQEAF